METAKIKRKDDIKSSRLEIIRQKEKKSKTTEVQMDNNNLERENEFNQSETSNSIENIQEEAETPKEELEVPTEEGKKYTILWFRITRSLIISSLLVISAFFLCIFGFLYKTFLNHEINENLNFDSIKPSVYATGTSYYKNKEIEKRIIDCLDAFKEMEALSKIDSKNINKYYKLNKQRFLLISGLPGIGKTFCVKSIIGEIFGDQKNKENWKCIEMKPDVLLNKYSGNSETALKNMFKEVSTQKDCKYILIFDECDDLITYPGVRNKSHKEEAPNYGGNLAINILTGFFLHLISTSDEIVSLPFICIFITNKEVEDIPMRVRNKFQTVEINLTDENIKEVIINYLADSSNTLNITLNSQELDDTLRVLKDLSVQRVIEVLHLYATENKEAYSFDKFLEFIGKMAEEKRKREDNFILDD